ncbi:MAG: thiamine phosphate synthase [Solirubrobacteraceae bacterium]
MLTTRHERLAAAHLYLLCEDIDGARLHAALRGGVDMVELLEPAALAQRPHAAADTPDGSPSAALPEVVAQALNTPAAGQESPEDRLLAAAARLLPICRSHNALLMLNNRPELVRAAEADGVHIDRPGIDIQAARAMIGPDRLLGVSATTPQQVDAAQRLPIDYFSVGLVHRSATRPNLPVAGHAIITYAASHSQLPFFAVGGVKPHNTSAIAAAGGRRIAVSQAITEATDPERQATLLRGSICSE